MATHMTSLTETGPEPGMQAVPASEAISSPLATHGHNGNGNSQNHNGNHAHVATAAALIRANSSRPSIVIPNMIIKRDGRVVMFDIGRIESALTRCFQSLNRLPSVLVEELAQQVVNIIAAKHPAPTVEVVQDIVETVLQAAGEYEAAKHYILYRAEHAKLRRAPHSRRRARGVRGVRSLFPDPVAKVPVLRQVFPVQLRSGPA